MLLCFAPLVILGYAQTIETSWHHSADLSGPYVEAQTCRDGFGGRVALSEQVVQAGIQYGYTIILGAVLSMTLNLHGGYGGSNTMHPRTGVRQITTLNVGASVSLNLDRYSLKLGVDHMSNGSGLNPANVGQDMASIGLGVQWGRWGDE